MLNPMGRLFSARKRGCNMRKIGKKLTGFMSDLNIGLFFVSIFSIMTTNFVYGATCETASTGNCKPDYRASNCTGTPATYYIKGQNACYSSCGAGCNNGYKPVVRTISTGGCTFTKTDCFPDANYAIVVTACDYDSNADIYETVCNTYGVSHQGGAIIDQLIKEQRLNEDEAKSLYSQSNCGVYDIKDPENAHKSKKVIMCFQNDIAVDIAGTYKYVSGSTMASALAWPCDNPCVSSSIETDWDLFHGTKITIENYAVRQCCYDGGCSGYNDYSTLTNNTEAQFAALKCCSSTGACSSHGTKGKIRCSPGYYSNKGVGDYTVSAGGPNKYLSYIDCVSCAEKTSDSKATSDAGSAAITDCYVESGYTGTNTKGSFQYPSSRCYYTND